MAEESEAVGSPGWNYFNYFTEVEEHFQRARGTGLFLMSPLDWALVESWKNSGVPLEAVLRGIDQAFEKWHAKKQRQRLVNSVAYCAQAVQEEAAAMAGAVPIRREPAPAPFESAEIRDFLVANAETVRQQDGYDEVASTLEALANDIEAHYPKLEQLEQRLTALEEKMLALARTRVTDEELFQHRRELDATLRPYRSKMSTEQIAMLERQYLARRIQEKAGLPRLSLFYLKPI